MQEVAGGEYRDVSGDDYFGHAIRVTVTQMDSMALLMVFHRNELQMYRLTHSEARALADALHALVAGGDEIAPAARNGSLDNVEVLGNGDVDLGVCYRPAMNNQGERVTLVVDRMDESYPGINHVHLPANGAYRLYVGLLEAST